MISIKKFLNARPEAESSPRRVASLLLEGIAVHAVDCDSNERAEFQNSLRKFRREVDSASDPAQALSTTGAAIQLLETYNRSIERFIRVRGKEYEEVVAMFSKSLIEISNAGGSAIQNLQGIAKGLQGISQIDDMRDLKSKLGESLKTLADEVARQKTENSAIAKNLEGKISSARAVMLSKPVEVDPVTGLPGHTAACRDLSALVASGQTHYVAILCVERLDLINTRFGFAVGDQILVIVSRHIARLLSPQDKLFRWRGPGLVAVLPRDAGLSQVQAELRNVAGERLEHNVLIGSRSVLLPISQAWSLLKLAGGMSADDVFAKIDAFVASQISNRE